MAKPIARRFGTWTSKTKRHEVVVHQGDSLFRIEGGVI